MKFHERKDLQIVDPPQINGDAVEFLKASKKTGQQMLRNRQTHLFKRGCTIFDCFLSDEICEEGISKKMSGSDVRWREKRI